LSNFRGWVLHFDWAIRGWGGAESGSTNEPGDLGDRTVTGDSHVLVGAYVLHALDLDERAVFEAHLRVCPDCVRETRELRAAALRLAHAVRANAPRWLRDSVLCRVAGTRQEWRWWWRR
jgi:hypothetical protein